MMRRAVVRERREYLLRTHVHVPPIRCRPREALVTSGEETQGEHVDQDQNGG